MTQDPLPEGIHKRIVNGTTRYIAQIRLNGKRISHTFSLVESAVYWLKDRQKERGDKEIKDDMVVSIIPRPIRKSGTKWDGNSSNRKIAAITHRHTFDKLTDIFVNNHQDLHDHEFMNIYWGLGEHWRKPHHVVRYKQLMLSKRKGNKNEVR